MELTRQEFEQILDQKFEEFERNLDKKFATKDDLKAFATKDDLQDALKAQSQELKEFAVQQTEVLARITNNGFSDVMERINVLDRKFLGLDHRPAY